MMRLCRGFTLVELLVTTSLMAVVGGTAVAALAGGLQVWGRAKEFGTQQQAILITFDQIRRDLQNTRTFQAVPFQGRYDQCAFAAVDRMDGNPDAAPEIGRLGYFLDEPHRVLCRSFVPYRLAGAARLTDRCDAVLEGVTRVRFSYFGQGKEGGEAAWRQSWDAARPPLAVKAEVSVRGAQPEATTHTLVASLTGAPVADADAPPSN